MSPVHVERGRAVRPDPHVSVIIPAYKPKWLDETLESVRAQTHDDWEIVVIDDGSPEPVRPARTDDLVLIRQPNAGPGGARNRGVEHARGTLVALLDDDDRWRPHKLATQVALHAAQPDLVMSCTEHVVTDGKSFHLPKTTVRQRARFKGDRIPYDRLFYENCVACSSVVLRRDVFLATGGMEPHRRMGEDYSLWLRVALQGPIGYLDEPLLERRHHPQSLMFQQLRDGSWFEQERTIYEQLLREHPELADQRFVRAALARLDFQGGWGCLARGDWANARRALLRSIRRFPFRPRAWFDLARAILHIRPLGPVP